MPVYEKFQVELREYEEVDSSVDARSVDVEEGTLESLSWL